MCNAQRFDSPTLDNVFPEQGNNAGISYPMDVCRNLGSDCGLFAASDWCLVQNMATMLSFSTAMAVARAIPGSLFLFLLQ